MDRELSHNSVVPFSSPDHFSVFHLITLALQHIYGMADFLIVVFSSRQRFSATKKRKPLYTIHKNVRDIRLVAEIYGKCRQVHAMLILYHEGRYIK